MSAPQRLTIDTTVARDFLDPKRERHELAKQLFVLAQAGEVELAVAPQGHRLDVEENLAEQLRATFAGEGVEETRQLARVSGATYPSANLFPGQYVHDFDEAWDGVAATWRSHEGKPPKLADRFHVETHVLERRDFFVTDDRPLLIMCRRLRDEHGITIEAMSLGEYLERELGPGGEFLVVVVTG